jgi:hypothetical protein
VRPSRRAACARSRSPHLLSGCNAAQHPGGPRTECNAALQRSAMSTSDAPTEWAHRPEGAATKLACSLSLSLSQPADACGSQHHVSCKDRQRAIASGGLARRVQRGGPGRLSPQPVPASPRWQPVPARAWMAARRQRRPQTRPASAGQYTTVGTPHAPVTVPRATCTEAAASGPQRHPLDSQNPGRRASAFCAHWHC